MRWFLGGSALALAALTLLIVFNPHPVGQHVEQALRWYLLKARYLGVLPTEMRIERTISFVEWTANIAMLIPTGFVLAGIIAPRWRFAVVPALGLTSCLIELVQWKFLPERTGSLADIAANTLGALLGYLALVWVSRSLERRRPRHSPFSVALAQQRALVTSRPAQ